VIGVAGGKTWSVGPRCTFQPAKRREGTVPCRPPRSSGQQSRVWRGRLRASEGGCSGFAQRTADLLRV